MRFHAHHRVLKEMIDAGDLGQVVFGRAQLTCWYPSIPGAWRQDPFLGGGGAYMDLGTHCLDLLEMFMGRARAVAAFSSTLTHGYPVDDSTTVMAEFESGAQGVVDVNYNIADEVSQNVLEVRGTRGAVFADHTVGQDAGGNMTAYLAGESKGYNAAQVRAEGQAQKIVVGPVNMYRAEVEHLSECIERDSHPINDGEDGLRSLRLALLVYESARTGRALRLDA
jgi:predicted dehydrogenase